MDMIKKNKNVKNKIWKIRQTIWDKKFSYILITTHLQLL
jgi:hypothetical protein